jgi:polyhydroxyalkanoate synthesis regulator phasin
MKNQLSEALLNELTRYNSINKYIIEQDELTAPTELTPEEPATPEPTDATLGGAIPPEGEATPEPGQPIDISTDPDVEEITDAGDVVTTDDSGTDESTESGTEEIDITELVSSQKNIETKQEEYMTSMMSKLEDLETKLSQMDSIFEKINSLEDKIEKYRPKTPEEKLHLRSLDSYPYNQKLSDFFSEKQPEMEETGKNVYTLTPEDIEDVDKTSIRKSFDLGLQN